MLEVVSGSKIVRIYIVVLSEFEEGQFVFVSVYPSVNSAKWRGVLIFLTGPLFC